MKQALDKGVVKQAKTQLTKKKKNASKELHNSIKYDLKISKNSFELSFIMQDYGKFIDKGVSGKNDNSFKGKKKRVHRSESGYRFGSGNYKGQGDKWKKKINSWMYSRGIAPRDKKSGRFITRDSVNFLIRRSIFQHGLKANHFFTRPFDVAFKQLPDDLVEVYGLEVEKLLKNTVR